MRMLQQQQSAYWGPELVAARARLPLQVLVYRTPWFDSATGRIQQQYTVLLMMVSAVTVGIPAEFQPATLSHGPLQSSLAPS